MNILVVESDAMTLQLLQEHIRSWGHTVHAAPDGATAWEIVRTAPIDMVVTDWMLPQMTGLELYRKIREEFEGRHLYLVIISRFESRDDVICALERGVDDYVTKPIDFDALRARIAGGARVLNLEKELNRRYKTIQKNYFQTLHMFTNLIGVFDENLGDHSLRVARLAMNLARRHPQVADDAMPMVEAAGLLHDIGIVGLPNTVLTKKKIEMTGDERRDYQAHPVQGEVILKEVDFLHPVALLVRAHHEQYNGRGFPDGLRREEIPLIARVISAADAYDHMVYQRNLPLGAIPENLQQQRGYQLDPRLVDLLIEYNAEHMMEEAGKDFLDVALDELTEGMMLARNIRRKNGALLMPVMTELTLHGIEKLNTYRELANISKKISVFKCSVRS
jgi:cyclic di-GMP phosphodiesterase